MNRKEAREVKTGKKVAKSLKQVVRQTTSPYWLVTRAKIILRAAAGESNSQIARELEMTRSSVIKWRRRWEANHDRLGSLEEAESSEQEVREVLESVLTDAPRSGAPPIFSAEQVVQIVAIACEDPALSGRPISHWTPREVAEEAVKRGIVESISPRQAGRFLKRGGLETPSEQVLAES